MVTGLFAIAQIIKDLINTLLPIIIALTVLVFVYGIFKMVLSGDDAKGREEARGYIIFGIIALFVMVSVWGLVNILVSTLYLNNTAPAAPAVLNVTN